MTVSPKIRAALEAARDALAEIVAEAPEKEPVSRGYRGSDADWLHESLSWDRAETARPALEKINAALAEMEAQS